MLRRQWLRTGKRKILGQLQNKILRLEIYRINITMHRNSKNVQSHMPEYYKHATIICHKHRKIILTEALCSSK